MPAQTHSFPDSTMSAGACQQGLLSWRRSPCALRLAGLPEGCRVVLSYRGSLHEDIVWCLPTGALRGFCGALPQGQRCEVVDHTASCVQELASRGC